VHTLQTLFECPFCNHESSCDVKFDRKKQRAQILCRICSETYETDVNCKYQYKVMLSRRYLSSFNIEWLIRDWRQKERIDSFGPIKWLACGDEVLDQEFWSRKFNRNSLRLLGSVDPGFGQSLVVDSIFLIPTLIRDVQDQWSVSGPKVVVICSIDLDRFVLNMKIITTRLKKKDRKMWCSSTKHNKDQKLKNFLAFVRTYFEIVSSTPVPGPIQIGPAHL
jgi:hypothetical protein